MNERIRIVATRALQGAALGELAGHFDLQVWPERRAPSPEALATFARDCDGLLCLLTDRIDAALFERCPRLRVVSSVSVGVDHVDLDAATARGIPVGHTPGVLTETTGDLAFALLLAAARRVAEGDRFVRAGGWTAERVWEPDMLLGCDIHGATLGLVGLGAIGQAMARRAQGFGMRVVAWSRMRREVPGVEFMSLDSMLAAADFVSVHVALAAETRGLLGAAAIARIKPGAVLVNTARGGIVDEDALADALRSGHLRAAGLDVFAREPLEVASPLRDLPNVVLTPHIGSASEATRARMIDLAVRNLLAALAGQRMPHCANSAVYAQATRGSRLPSS